MTLTLHPEQPPRVAISRLPESGRVGCLNTPRLLPQLKSRAIFALNYHQIERIKNKVCFLCFKDAKFPKSEFTAFLTLDLILNDVITHLKILQTTYFV
jgi:hypothetical protein